MKSLSLLFVLFSLFNSVYAQNLCDESCEFSATFPEGGSLEAIDELTLTFGPGGELTLGTGGTVNTAIQPASLDFSSGGTLVLSAGESITFGPGGSLVLGTGGNLDALDYSLETTGDLTIEPTGGNESINLTLGDLDVSGTMTITLNSLEINSANTAGTQLNLQNSTNISGSGSIINNGTLVLSGNELPTISNGTGSAIILVGTVENTVTEGTIQPGSLVLTSGNGVISNVIGPLTPIDNNVTITVNPDSLQPLQSLDALNGIEMTTSDGNNCIIESPECVADDGTVYVLDTESKLVKKEAPSDTSTSGNSGSFGLPLLGFFIILLFSSGTRKRLSSEI